MSNYNSDLKTWGSQGEVFPDGYNYIQGEQPVDAWDNYFASRTISDLFHLIDLTNDRLESDAGSSHPTSPEPGHFSHRTDAPIQGEDTLYYYDSTNDEWHRVMDADGDVMEGVLDMGGYIITDSDGTVSLDETNVSGTLSEQGNRVGTRSWVQSNYMTSDHQKNNLYSEAENGWVESGNFEYMELIRLEDGDTLNFIDISFVKQKVQPVPSGLDLILATTSSTLQTVLSGDGTTTWVDEPITASYTNTSGSDQTVLIGMDNGHYNSGSGSDQPIHVKYTVEVN